MLRSIGRSSATGVKKSGDGVNKNGDTSTVKAYSGVSIFVHPVPTFFHPDSPSRHINVTQRNKALLLTVMGLSIATFTPTLSWLSLFYCVVIKRQPISKKIQRGEDKRSQDHPIFSVCDL